MLFTFPSRYWFAIGLSRVFSLAGWSPLLHAEFLVFRATQDTAWIRGASDTRLSLSVVQLSNCFSSPLFMPIWQSYNPNEAGTSLVWALARSLATTCAIIRLFSLPQGTKMFQFPWFASSMNDDDMSSTCRVVPFGDPRIKGHLHLPAAFRSLSRPSSPVRAQASAMRPFLLSLDSMTMHNASSSVDILSADFYSLLIDLLF